MGDAWDDVRDPCWNCGELHCECPFDFRNEVTVAPIGEAVLPIEYYPEKKTKGAAGFDLVNNGDAFVIEPGQIVMVPTGLAWQIPPTSFGMVCSRSGLATKGILVINAPGIVDSDYRGEVKVILGNVGKQNISIEQYDRVAQMVIAPSGWNRMETRRVELKYLTLTERGTGGFGSTGK